MTVDDLKYMFYGQTYSGFNATDERMYERLKTKLPVEICIHSPPKRNKSNRFIGKRLVVYLNKLVVHDWR